MKLLSLDLETQANVGYSFGKKFETSIAAYIRESYLLSFAYQWVGQKKITVRSLPDFRSYRKDIHDDRRLCLELKSLLEEADAVIGHNIDGFDIPYAFGRFLVHKMTPPKNFKTIDTLKICRKNFNWPSNSLKDVADRLGIGQKGAHEGITLWVKCDLGDLKAWRKMTAYNKQDVRITTRLYLYLLPWISNHPNRNIYDGTEDSCPACGSKEFQRRGYRYTPTNKFRSYCCKKCGRNFQARKPELSTKNSVKVK